MTIEYHLLTGAAGRRHAERFCACRGASDRKIPPRHGHSTRAPGAHRRMPRAGHPGDLHEVPGGPSRSCSGVVHWSCAPPICSCWKGFPRHYADIGEELDCQHHRRALSGTGRSHRREFWYGAFHGTNLDDLLKAFRWSRCWYGTVTQICVEETARESFHHRLPDDDRRRCRLLLHAGPACRRAEELRPQIRVVS